MLVRAFGAIDVATGDGPRQPVGGRRQRLILALLVSRLGDVVPDDAITEAIWGDGAPPSARTAVQTYLSGLRDLLEPDRPRHSAGSFISHEGGGYRLALGGEQLDVARFVADVDEAARIHNSDRAAATALLDGALDLWAEPPLAEFADEPWALAAVAGWRDQRATAIEARVGFALDAGAEHDVLALLRSAVADYPYRERLAGQMMLALYRSGEQRDALAEYSRIRRALHDDLGLDPGRELQLLERAILDQDPALLRRDATAVAATPVAARGDGLPAARRLVGRNDELDALDELLTAHRCVAVVGPGGAGKTALAVTAARRFQKRFDAAVVHVDLARHRGRDPLRAIAAERQVVEHPLAPLSATVSDALGQRPTLLVIETCELDPEGVTGAVEALVGVPGLRVLLTSQVATGGRDVHVVRLGGLAPDAAIELLSRSLDRDEPVDALAEIAHQLNYLPLGLQLAASRLAALGAVELLRGMRNDPDLLLAAAADDRHRSVRAAADWSIGLLPADTATALSRLAGFAGPFTLGAARAILDDEDGASTVRFVGDLVERSLVARLDGVPARFRLPDSVTDSLEHADADAVSRARTAVAHLVLDAAQRDLVASSQPMARRRSPGETVGADAPITDPPELVDLEHELLPALASFADGGDGDDARELLLAGLLGTHFQRTGRISEGRERLDDALRRHADAPPVVVCAAAAQAGFLAWYQGDGRATADLLDRIESQLDDVPLAGFADTVRGCRAFSQHDYTAAADHLAAAAAVARGRSRQRMLLLHTAGNAAWYAKRLDVAGECYIQQGELAEEAGDEFNHAQSLRFGAMLAAGRGELDRAWRWAERSRQTAVRMADPLSQAQSAVAVAVVAWRSGDGAAMKAAAAEAVGHSRHHFDVFVLRTALPMLAGRSLELDQPEVAAELLGWYLDLLERTAQGPSMAVRDVADDVERDTRAALGRSDFGRIAGRGAARSISELADAVR